MLRNLGANAYGQLITIVVQLVSVPLFLHYWGVALYGEWLILSAIPAYLSLSDIGFASVAANDMTMRVAKGDKQGALEVYQSIWVLICAVSIAVGSVLALLIYTFPLNNLFSISHISAEHTQLALIVLMLYVLIGLQGGVLSAAFRSAGRYAYGTIMNNTVRLAEWFVSILALVLGGSVLVVASVTFAVRFIGLIITWSVIRKQERWLSLGFKAASMQKIRELLKPAIGFMAFPLGLALSLQGMVLLIGITLGSVAVVIFSAYRTLTRLLVQIITMLNQAVWPEISAAYGAGNIDLVSKIHRKGSCITFWVALTSVIAMGLLGEWIIGIWTHYAFEQNHILLSLLLATTFLNVLWQTSWVVLMATNQHHKISIVFVLSAILGLLSSAMVIPYLGINGVGLMLVISEMPILFITINGALLLLHDRWFNYLKSILSNPLTNQTLINSSKPTQQILVNYLEGKETIYKKGIQGRTKFQYLKGLVPRFISYLRNSYIVHLARKRGAIVGDCVTMPYKLAKKANANLIIGNNTSIQTERIDLRSKVEIGSYVIIGSDVEIITVSHNVDSTDWEHKTYGIIIEDYCWLATRAFILPSCRKVEYGAVCAAGSVVASNVAAMQIVTGNPAKLLRVRKNVHKDLCVESMLGNDYLSYKKSYQINN